MEILFELSKEHNTIPKSEIISCLKAEGIIFNIIRSDSDVFIIQSDISKNKIHRLAERLSFTFFIDEILFSCGNNVNEIMENANNSIITQRGSIAINYKNRSKNINSRSILKIIGDIFTKNRQVNLDNPDIQIRVFITDKNIYVGINIAKINRSEFEKRKVQKRPFFSPISLHPKLARALVNFSQIKKDQKLLDPFCGTGGILLEAGLIGARPIGCDIEEKMVEGCKKTLKYYKIKDFLLYTSDIGNIDSHIGNVDAVVTDLPYGKSTTTKGENIDILYNRSFNIISKILKNNGIAVVVSPNKNIFQFGKNYFSTIEEHEIKVHRSLTRYIGLFQK